MAFIWENYSLSKRYVVGKKISPYMEIFSDAESVIPVNPLIRFNDLFSVLESVDCLNLETDVLENILFHYLASFDLLRGIDQKQIGINYLERELQDGYWGVLIKENWAQINEKHKEIILHSLYMKVVNHSPKDYFFMAIQKLFSVVSLVYEKDTDTHYLYIGETKTEYAQMLVSIVVSLFGSIQNNIEIIWEKHYGIIGSDNTMKISEILIV